MEFPKSHQLEEKTSIYVYRIIQEILQNCIKHSHASNIKLKVQKDSLLLILDIHDNGVGFDPSQITEGLGLNNLRSRIKYLHGRLELNIAPKQGCHYHIEIPLNESS